MSSESINKSPVMNQHLVPVSRGILLICPSFFNYYKDIHTDLERRGLNVTWLNTWLYEHSIYKALLRLFHKPVSYLSTHAYLKQIEKLPSDSIQEILVIRGEGISRALVIRLRKRFPQARLLLHVWDGIDNCLFVKEFADLFDGVSTFDPVDARVFGWKYRPLFARNIQQLKPTGEKSQSIFDWVFIGSLHSDRFRVLKRLTLNTKHLRSYAFCFVQGKLALGLRFLRDLMFFRPPSMKISTTAMTVKSMNEIMDTALISVDIEHAKQRGLTMRTIEALLQNRKLATTNQSILESDLYHETRVHVLDRKTPTIPDQFLNTKYLPISQDLVKKYSLAGWLDDILSFEYAKN